MHTQSVDPWRHSHSFGQERFQQAEKYTWRVILITTITMFIEIAAGLIFGSMALLADGLHMGSHSLALVISVIAYYFTRKHAHDARYSFGTGKINSLGGYTSAVLLVIFTLLMAGESVKRLIAPISIKFDQALLVAIVGLIVNVVSIIILSRPRNNGNAASHYHNHDHHSDHNLKAAYLHVLADALTSVFAIFALLMGKFWGLIWMDPLMGIVGAFMVSRWAVGLIRDTSNVLLDKQAPIAIQNEIKAIIENYGHDKIADLHVWSIGSNDYAVNLSIVSDDPKPPEYYKKMLAENHNLAYITIETHSKWQPQHCDKRRR